MIESFSINQNYSISRIIKGGWQLSEGHGMKVSADPVKDMFEFVKRGIYTFDCADIYTGVEEMIGRFVKANQELEDSWSVKIHTKYVPDYNQLGKLNKSVVENIIDRSLSRLKLDRLDMVQFHWWNYEVPGWVETAHWLQEIQQSGKINLLSTTNFNSQKTKEILDGGVQLATLQVQYSLLDPRPEKELVGLCSDHKIHLLCYGTLAGGFFNERWLGVTEPESFENRSLIKYKLIIDEIGGWDLFQELLKSLDQIAKKHQVTIATVATKYILDQSAVAAAIVGARNLNHIDSYDLVFSLCIDQEDVDRINNIKSQMSVPPYDVFDLERDKEGRHGRIMKYNLNAT